MRRHRFMALAGLLVLAGCAGDNPRSLGPVPTAPTTSTTTATTLPVTSTTPATTAAPVTTARASTTTTAGPRVVSGIPQVAVTPARAPIGGRIRIEGTGFTDDMWTAQEAPLWLVATRGGCNLYAPAKASVTVSPQGRLTGEFTVPFTGGCRMSDQEQFLTAGTYRIVFACTPCSIGQLEVTTSATACPDIAFAPNSDNLASAIVAAGMDCAEADAVVRKAGAQAGPVRSATFMVDGFSCVQTAFSDRGLPSADYECTSGSKKVTYHRT